MLLNSSSTNTGQVFSQNLANLRDQSKTGEGAPDDDDSYLGYSVTTGGFDGDGDDTDVAVGMPRGAKLNGKVSLGVQRSLPVDNKNRAKADLSRSNTFEQTMKEVFLTSWKYSTVDS